MPELTTDVKGLKKMLIDADLNQIKLSEKSGISKQTVTRIINGKTKPSLTTIQKIAWAVNKPTEEVCKLFVKE